MQADPFGRKDQKLERIRNDNRNPQPYQSSPARQSLQPQVQPYQQQQLQVPHQNVPMAQNVVQAAPPNPQYNYPNQFAPIQLGPGPDTNPQPMQQMMPPVNSIYAAPPQQNLMPQQPMQQQYMVPQMQAPLLTPPTHQQNEYGFQRPEPPQYSADGFFRPPAAQQMPPQLATPPSFQ